MLIMRQETLFWTLAFGAIGQAAPLQRLHAREVPQEHSHNSFLASVRTSLALDNPDSIQDPVFGLLGNAAAAAGQGSITDTDCLHQATADQAFTNAKSAGDVKGMTNALIYAALERNTGKVGLASVLCTAISAKNPEIAAVSQHQDPASPGAAESNKAVTLELAKQIASVGGDPQEALKSGTFAPGDVNDPTAKGNTCDTLDDELGCIFTQKLLVEDATAEEINAAVAGVRPPNGSPGSESSATTAAAPISTGNSSATSKDSIGGDAPLSNKTASTTSTTLACGSTSSSSTSTTSSTNIQTFTGALGSPPPPVTSSPSSSRPFSVNGATFLNAAAALKRSCAIQHNTCANAANSDSLTGGVAQCDAQEIACNAAAVAGTQRKYRKRQAAVLDFGSCTDPTIQFAEGLDGRKEKAFAPSNEADFNHGSALNIGIICEFICQQLGDKCKADTEALSACEKGKEDSAKVKGQAAADAFNAALGGDVGSGDAGDDKGEGEEEAGEKNGDAACNAAASGTASAPASTPSSATAVKPDDTEQETGSSTTGSNIQTFTGAVGGLPPPVIRSSGARPFSVKGETFGNASAALQRSCAVQHNACADAANKGSIEGGVGECEKQEKECNAAGGK
ncbi:MAG: hypothetical protein Q9182_007273 [Xanthomendoza sp. 2 TL-2023]